MYDRVFYILSDSKGTNYIYNLYTGIKFEIDSFSKDIIVRDYERIEEYEDLYEALIRYDFIDITYKKLEEKIPIVSPYVIWNRENIVYPDMNGQYKIKKIEIEEYRFLNLINGITSLAGIFESLMNVNYSQIKHLLSYEMQCIKLIDKKEVKGAEMYFDCPIVRGEIHEEKEWIDNNEYYNQIKKGREKEQFEIVETTVSYMLRDKTRILNNRSFGECFIEQILKRYDLGLGLNILEVGGGLADMADAILGYFDQRKIECTYSICDNSSVLSQYQEEKLNKKYTSYQKQFIVSDIENLNVDKTYNVIISNEVIADLRSENVDKNISDSCKKLVEKYQIKDVKGKYINTGAIRFIEMINKLLEQGGIAVLTEYTDNGNASNISNMMPDHIEVSINFEVLKQVAQKNRLNAKVINMQEFFDITNCLVLAGESYYALKCIYNDLKKKFYTEDEVKRFNILGYKNLRYEPLSNILNFFRVLILQKEK